MQSYNKHYVRLDGQNSIIKGFSDAFEQPQEGDICINEEGGRHFQLGDKINPVLTNDYGVALYKWENGEVTERTAEEIQAEIPLPSLQSFTITTDKPQITADGADTAIITIALNPLGTGIELIDILIDGVPIHELTPVVNDVATFEFSATDAGKYIIEAISGKVRDYILIKAVTV